jgi:hypothetical protein
VTIGWDKTIPVWWSFFWRALIYGVAAGFVLGFIAGFGAAMMHSPQNARFAGMIAGYIGSIPASMFAFKQALTKHVASLVAIANARAPAPTELVGAETSA